MTYHLYRLKETEENTIPLFMNSKNLTLHGFWPPKPDDYEQIWQGSIHGADHNRVLDQIYAKFNVDKPLLFRTRYHSMSVGDIVVLTDNDKTAAYFCDSYGWTELPDFYAAVADT